MKYFNLEAGNISSVEFVDKWPSGRSFKHGAMKVYFVFLPKRRISAVADIESMMENHGYQRGVDYHVPGWNFNLHNERLCFDHVYITFNDIENFIMAKLVWDVKLDQDDI